MLTLTVLIAAGCTENGVSAPPAPVAVAPGDARKVEPFYFSNCSTTTWSDGTQVTECDVTGGGSAPPSPPPSGGSVPGGSGGGGTSYADPNDVILHSDTTLNCGVSQSETHAITFCQGSPPTGTRLANISDALARMRAKGGVCATMADVGQGLLATHLRVFEDDGTRTYDFTAFTHRYPSGEAFVGISSRIVDYLYAGEITTPTGYRVSLQSTLAHELDHVRGDLSHVAGTGNFYTANTFTCGGL